MKLHLLFILSFLLANKTEATVGYSLFNAMHIATKWNLSRGIHTKIPIGVVGTGRIGRMHIENMIKHIPEVQICGSRTCTCLNIFKTIRKF